MKRSTAAILLSIVFAIVFYHQDLGINVLIYGAIASLFAVVVLFSAKRPTHHFALAVLPFLFAASSAGINGTVMPVFVSFAAFGFLGAQIANPRVDPISSVGMGLLNFIVSPFRLFTGTARGLKVDSKLQRKIISYVLLPACFVALFSVFYASANPVFEKLLEQINWDFLRADLFWVLLLGALFSVVVFRFYIPPIYFKLLPTPQKERDEVPPYEPSLLPNTWAVIFFTLSALLLFVISSDFVYRFVLHTMPEGLNRSAYLHRGIFSLIVSILLAIGLIAFVFQRESTKLEKASAIFFMLLNLVFIVQNGEKNFLYIAEYGMTMKRLGVFLYLFMTSVGVVLTLILISGRITLIQLVQFNSYNIFYSLVLFSCFNWPRVITRHNLSHVPATTGQVDLDYLFQFRSVNLDIIQRHIDPTEIPERYQYKIERFKQEYEEAGFLSRSVYDHLIYRNIIEYDNHAE